MEEHDLISRIIKNDIDYFQTFSDIYLINNAIVFYNPRLEGRYDANKAIYLRAGEIDAERLLDDIRRFYYKRELVPRLELDPYFTPEILPAILKEKGWDLVNQSTYHIMILENRPDKMDQAPETRVEKIDYFNLSDLLFILDFEFREHPQRVDLIHSAMYEIMSGKVDYYVLYADDRPVAKACLFEKGDLTRLENVFTLPRERKRGYSTQLVNHLARIPDDDRIVFLFAKKDLNVEKFYAKNGFRTIFDADYRIYTLENVND